MSTGDSKLYGPSLGASEQLLRGSYVFEYRPSIDILDESIESVIVSGTFNDWRRNDKLQRVEPGLWKAEVEFSFPVERRYFLYKFYLQQRWTSDIPTQEDRWVIDYEKPVMLHEAGRDCNYLRTKEVKLLDPPPTPFPIRTREGTFCFFFLESAQFTVPAFAKCFVVVQDYKGKKSQHALKKVGPTRWQADVQLSIPIFESLYSTRYWYMIDGERRYDYRAQMGTDDYNNDCNVLYAHDLTTLSHDGSPIPMPTRPEDYPAHEIKIYLRSKSTQDYLITSFDNWQTKHRFVPARGYKDTTKVDIRVPCPVSSILYWYLLVGGARDTLKSRPVTMLDGVLVNYQVFGRPYVYNTVTAPEKPLSLAKAYALGQFQFNWPGTRTTDIWVLGPFNNWTKSDAYKLILSPKGTSHILTVKLPIRRTRYKYMDSKGWLINPMARIEFDENTEKKEATNYLLPEDFEILDEATALDLNLWEWSVPHEWSSTPGFKLSPRAAEGRGM